jgi:hypothetical protein
LDVKNHALGRFLQRHPAGDLRTTLFDAHRAALRLPVAALNATELFIPAGDGMFLCRPFNGPDVTTGEHSAHLQAVTWLHRDQLRDDQHPAEPGRVGSRLGDAWFRPAPLRRVRRKGNAFIVMTPDWAEGLGMPADARH